MSKYYYSTESDPRSKGKGLICGQNIELSGEQISIWLHLEKERLLSKISETTRVGETSDFPWLCGGTSWNKLNLISNVSPHGKSTCTISETSVMLSSCLLSGYLVPFAASECSCLHLQCSARTTIFCSLLTQRHLMSWCDFLPSHTANAFRKVGSHVARRLGADQMDRATLT